MLILTHLWQYWKWLCVALMTTFVVFALAAAVINHFKSSAPASNGAAACIESGGTWDEGEQFCKAPA